MTQGYVASPTFFNSDNFTPGFYLDSGVPTYAAPPVLDPSYVNRGNPYYIAPGYGRPGMIQNWSFQIQQQLTSDLMVSAAYVGNHSTHLRSNLLNINNIVPAYFTLGDALNPPVGSAAAQPAGVTAPYSGFTGNVSQALRPFPQYGAIVTSTIENAGQSTYEALQVSVEQRLRAGLSLQIGFTWSKTLTDADSLDIPDYTGVSAAQNPYNLNGEKAISMQSLPLVFTGSWIYELPFGSGKKYLNHSHFLSAVVGGWQIGGVQRYQSGAPVSFGCATTIPGWDNCVRFNRVPGQNPLSAAVPNGTFDPFVNSYYNPAAFVDPNANRSGGAYRLGNYPRVAEFARMRPFYNEDFSIIKSIPLHFSEFAKLQLKTELLNAFNRHVFSPPDTNPYSPTFGLITPSGAWSGSAGTVDQPRIVQFSLRLNFQAGIDSKRRRISLEVMMRRVSLLVSLIGCLRTFGLPPDAVIQVDASKVQHPIPRTIYGTFLEPIGRSIYGGLWAQILDNPSLEENLWAPQRIAEIIKERPELEESSSIGLPLPWESLDRSQGRRFEPRWGDTANSSRSLLIMALPGKQTGVRQEVYLPVHRVLRYTGSLYAKPVSGGRELEVSLRRRNRPDEVLARQAVRLSSDGWTRYEYSLELPTAALASREPADFAVAASDEARILIDQVFLFPADHIDGLNPEIVAMARALKTPLVRFGGNFTSGVSLARRGRPHLQTGQRSQPGVGNARIQPFRHRRVSAVLSIDRRRTADRHEPRQRHSRGGG